MRANKVSLTANFHSQLGIRATGLKTPVVGRAKVQDGTTTPQGPSCGSSCRHSSMSAVAEEYAGTSSAKAAAGSGQAGLADVGLEDAGRANVGSSRRVSGDLVEGSNPMVYAVGCDSCAVDTRATAVTASGSDATHTPETTGSHYSASTEDGGTLLTVTARAKVPAAEEEAEDREQQIIGDWDGWVDTVALIR